MNKLFDITESNSKENKNTCKDCKHRERWQCNSKVFQYCKVRKSKRTQNGLLKIKCKDKSCLMFKPTTQ
jgi:beta-lactamase superfamily II metal-dependent hydrolase